MDKEVLEEKDAVRNELSDLYQDEKQKSAEILKEKAKKIKGKYSLESPMPIKIINSIISVLFTGIISFAWMLLMLMIISFVSLSYLHFKIDTMLLVSIVFGILAAIIKIARIVWNNLG